jgi:hypothetical protein
MADLEPGMSPGDGWTAIEPAAPPAVASEPAPSIASLNETASRTVEPSTAASEPVNVPETTVPAPKIVALGSPEATDNEAREKEASSEARAKAYRNFISNRLRAQRAAKARRRLAHRARMVRRAAVRQPPPPAARATAQQQPPAAFTTVPATTFIPAAENPYRF